MRWLWLCMSSLGLSDFWLFFYLLSIISSFRRRHLWFKWKEVVPIYVFPSLLDWLVRFPWRVAVEEGADLSFWMLLDATACFELLGEEVGARLYVDQLWTVITIRGEAVRHSCQTSLLYFCWLVHLDLRVQAGDIQLVPNHVSVDRSLSW